MRLLDSVLLGRGSRLVRIYSDAPRRNALLALVCFALVLFSTALFAFVLRFVLA